MADFSGIISQIERAESLQQIREAVSAVSAAALNSNAGGVLWSGMVDGVNAEKMAVAIAQAGGLNTLGQTARSALLND